MSAIRFVKPDKMNLSHIVKYMRKEDKIEIMAYSGFTPKQAVELGVKRSDLISVALINDEPCAIFGLVKGSLLTETGTPWLLGTDLIDQHKKSFVKHTKLGIEQMLNVCPKLSNYVHCKHIKSIRWLTTMGFQFRDPEPVGLNKELFVEFFLEK